MQTALSIKAPPASLSGRRLPGLLLRRRAAAQIHHQSNRIQRGQGGLSQHQPARGPWRRQLSSRAFFTHHSRHRSPNPSSRDPSSLSSEAPRDKMACISLILTPEVLLGVREFWFEHLSGPDALIIPNAEANKRWFFGGPDFDKLCVERFGPTLAAIRSRGITSGHDIIYALQPTDAHDWLSLVLLLDQIPRNCFRGESSASVFTYWDPMARDVALAALERGIPDRWPEIRWRFACRAWFYVPLMHAEDAPLHELAVGKYQLLARDVESLMATTTTSSDMNGERRSSSSSPGEDDVDDESDDDDDVAVVVDREYRLAAQKVVQADPGAAREYAQLNLGFEKRHWAVVRRFGRYPHRNGVLGRETTEEEREYLDNGGDTFGG